MRKPLIGISSGQAPRSNGLNTVSVPLTYVESVRRAGGVPLVLPVGLAAEHLVELRDRLDGVILSGGADVAVERFGGQPHPRVYGVDEERDELELGLARQAAESGWPLLAICRGIQVLNVALGGTLYTHIPDQLPSEISHSQDDQTPYDFLAHSVTLVPDCRLAGIFGATQVMVNSWHHQGVKQVGQGLKAVGHSPDTLVEAVEWPVHPFLIGVQWHPEWMPDSPHMQALFQAFVQAASGSRTAKSVH